jgi:hypothetical protein
MKTKFIFVILAGLAAGSSTLVSITSSDTFDQKFAIIQTCEPVVRPVIGEALPATGQVRLAINVDSTGKLVDWMVIDYAHLRYANAAVEAVKQWEYKPAVFNGTPIGVRTELVFDFEARGQVVSLSGIDTIAALLRGIGGNQQIRSVCAGRELDSPPKPIVVVSPLPVRSVGVNSEDRGVRVDFFIDETGRPRMATVDARANELMAASSLQAIEQWRFTPPTRKGYPISVRASQWFDFSQSLAVSK